MFVLGPSLKEGKKWVMRENEEGGLKEWWQCCYVLQSEKYRVQQKQCPF